MRLLCVKAPVLFSALVGSLTIGSTFFLSAMVGIIADKIGNKEEHSYSIIVYVCLYVFLSILLSLCISVYLSVSLQNIKIREL